MRELNGLRVVRSPGGAIFIPLPRKLWREIDGGCNCAFCRRLAGRKSYWDTLAISGKAPASREEAGDYTWGIHRPEEHPYRLEEGEKEV